jgi:1-acyl-sn-glycerol-3-phosphate acyltransferase
MLTVSRKTMVKWISFLMHSLTTFEFKGLENIPQNGGVVITTNHLSRVDTTLLLMNPVRTDLKALVTDKYKSHPIIGFIASSAEMIWLDRTKADFGAFKQAIEYLKQGGALGIAPEGTRSTTGGLIEGKPGTILLALKTDAPIVPVGLVGTESAVAQLKKFKRPYLCATFGPAYHLPPLDRENRDAQMQRSTDEVMCRIAALIPEKYRGFYANHPRLKELLQGDYSFPG